MSARQRPVAKRTSPQHSKCTTRNFLESSVKFGLKLEIKLDDGSVTEQLMHLLLNDYDVKFAALFCDGSKIINSVKLSKSLSLVSHHESAEHASTET